MLPVLILCGGSGSRLRDVTRGIVPKALVPVAGRPFIDWKLEQLSGQGLEEVVLSVGLGGKEIIAHVRDGARFGVRARYVDDGQQLLGTGGAVAAALPSLPQAFWITYGDTILEVDAADVEARFQQSRKLGAMTVLANRDRQQPSNATVSGDLVTAYSKNPPPRDAEYIDYGMLVLSREAFGETPLPSPFDLGNVLGHLAARGELLAILAHAPFHDIGTPEALRQTEAYLAERTD
jgi:MurNAc alpha-1-phosphate uridylyltransferase